LKDFGEDELGAQGVGVEPAVEEDGGGVGDDARGGLGGGGRGDGRGGLGLLGLLGLLRRLQDSGGARRGDLLAL